MEQVDVRIAFIGLLNIAKAHYLDMKGLLMMLDEEQILQLLNWSVDEFPTQYPTLGQIIKKAIQIRKNADKESNLVDGEGSVEMIKP